jgi:hypothetical protein
VAGGFKSDLREGFSDEGRGLPGGFLLPSLSGWETERDQMGKKHEKHPA